jgi:hypothetical protein
MRDQMNRKGFNSLHWPGFRSLVDAIGLLSKIGEVGVVVRENG